MTRAAVLWGLVLWAGATLLLAEARWFRRPSLADRLAPYQPGGLGRRGRDGVLSVESFRDVVGPLARAAGGRASRLLGVSEELALRLERVHSPLEVTGFRVRQLGWTVAALGAGTLTAVALGPPPPVAALLVVGSPALAFLVVEQQVASASAAWQRRLFHELPVVAEQLAMLLSAGYSLGTALNRVAARGRGVGAADLARVCGRVRQGLPPGEALREWAAVARVDALDRLVPVLALERETADLGRLVSEEARAIRRDAHRRLVEAIERRAQQVWVPVTVAALLPGVVLMAVPFVEALRLFAGS